MKNVLIVLLFTISSVVSATDYYISATGNDNAAGTSPETAWQTITKVNSSFDGLKPGDRVLFNRGDTFYGTLIISKSGSASNRITIGAYGTGAKPIISGFITITGWTDETGGIYSKKVTCESLTNMVTVNGVNTERGRWPNTGFRTYESHNGDISITDNELTGTPNWTGAEAVIRKTPWGLDVSLITDHTDGTLTYTELPFTWESPNNGYGYFIQNDIKTLDTFGEWYFDGTDLYIYFGDKDPADYVVKVSTLNQVVKSEGNDYITFDNLSIEGGNRRTIEILTSDYITIQNCDIDFSGKIGIQTIQSIYTVIDNNSINHSNSNAISLLTTQWPAGNFVTVSNNTISNTGLFGGMLGDTTGIDDGGDGIVIKCENVTVEDNIIKNSGHSGMRFSYDNNIIQRNLVDSFALVRNDAGGIYGFAGAAVNDNSKITNNIVVNGIGDTEGIGGKIEWLTICGIYFDILQTSNLEISGNTVVNCRDVGIYLQSSNNVSILDNTVYNCDFAQLYLRQKAAALVRGIKIYNNIFISKVATQPVFLLNSNANDADIIAFGTADSNYYARPIDDEKIIITQPNDSWPGTSHTLAEWQAYSGQDANSHKSPIAIPVGEDIDDYIKFIYNPGKTVIGYDAKGNFTDITGKSYGMFNLEPNKSVFLLNTTDSPQEIDSLGSWPVSSMPSIASSIIMYPNPASDMINVLIPEIKDKTTLLLVDIAGRIMHTERIEFEHTSIDVSFLPKGIYMILLKGHETISSSKFIKIN